MHHSILIWRGLEFYVNKGSRHFIKETNEYNYSKAIIILFIHEILLKIYIITLTTAKEPAVVSQNDEEFTEYTK